MRYFKLSNNKNIVSLIYSDFREEIFNEIIEKNNYSQNNIFIKDLLSLENKLVLNYDWKNIIANNLDSFDLETISLIIKKVNDVEIFYYYSYKLNLENKKIIDIEILNSINHFSLYKLYLNNLLTITEHNNISEFLDITITKYSLLNSIFNTNDLIYFKKLNSKEYYSELVNRVVINMDDIYIKLFSNIQKSKYCNNCSEFLNKYNDRISFCLINIINDIEEGNLEKYGDKFNNYKNCL